MTGTRSLTYALLTRLEDVARRQPVNRRLRWLRQAQWWDAEETRRYRDRRVADLVDHAYRTTIFYRRRMDEAGVRPEHVVRVEDLVRLPEVTRDDLAASALEMLSDRFDRRKLESGTSSGSTGRSVRYWHDRRSLGMAYAAERWGWEISGWRAGDPTALVWGHPLAVESEWKQIGPRVKTVLFRELRIPAYAITEAVVADDALDRLERFRPLWIRGYANSIGFLAKRATQQERTVRCRGVLTIAENLQPAIRDVIETAFGPVYDGYGASEIAGVAHECPASGLYHVIEPHVVVECGEEYGEEGGREAIVTNLDEYGMPLIRYRLGDLVVPTDRACGCGRVWGCLETVLGRRNDLIETPGGGTLLQPAYFADMLLERWPRITQYQIAKVAHDAIEMRIVAEPALADEELREIERTILPYMAGMRLSAVRTDTLALSAGGKHRFVVDETCGPHARIAKES